jgi:hypothetical protein
MKSHSSPVLAVAGALILLGGGAARATIDRTVEFKTTFPFVVGATTVPAGSYTIKPDSDNENVLELSGSGVGVFFEVRDATLPKSPAQSELVFERYGDRYALHGVWLQGETEGAVTAVAEPEKHLAKSGAQPTEHRVPAKSGKG